jgi:hypothetical protein
MKELTQERVRELFDYSDGNLIRRKSVQSRSMAGTVAGCLSDRGRYIVSVDYRRYKLHRVIWLWHFGQLPEEIDHIDGNPSNNRIENMRAADRLSNMKNVKRPSTNTTGFKGVRLHSQSKRWTAQIVADRKHRYLGSFDTPEDAYRAYCTAATALHGEFARLA